MSASEQVRVAVLGAGFGGLELTARLSAALGDDLDLMLIDRSDHFVFGFSKLDVMFGRLTAHEVRHQYADIIKPGVRFVRAEVNRIDPAARRVTTSAGDFEADVLVIGLGAQMDPAATPGLTEGGHEFYTNDGAFAARDVLASFDGGHVVVGVSATPYKCPPAPSETVLLLHDFLSERGLREKSDITLVLPLPTPVPPAPTASQALLAAFDERGITFRGRRAVRSLDPTRHTAVLDDGAELPYDLFLGVPVHRAPTVVVESGLTVDGWIPVDRLTLRTQWPGVYAVGDVTSVGTPKAGVFSEGQAAVVADAIIAQVRGDAEAPTYGGRGVCYVEFGHDSVAGVDVTFAAGQPPTGFFDAPSHEIAAEKEKFGRDRLRRWFGKAPAQQPPAAV